MPQQEFTDVQHQLEQVIAKLKATTDAKVRQQLLRDMRRLLAEADRIIKSAE